ncbi:phage tail tube protein [Brevundimonas sp. CEF1]|uniref:phage tail tube protein n=1 Tax=Brevundimonas sp. CEF1 TaxID=3442642 RepID=UPI003F51915B
MAFKGTRGVRLVVKVGDGATPEVFTPLCTINAERGITFNAQTNDETIPDCEDLDAIAWLVREKASLSVDVTGGGKSHKDDIKKLWDWWKSPESQNCQVVVDDDVVANQITFEGPFHLAQFDLNGAEGQKMASTMSLSSDGEVTATFGANVGGA